LAWLSRPFPCPAGACRELLQRTDLAENSASKKGEKRKLSAHGGITLAEVLRQGRR